MKVLHVIASMDPKTGGVCQAVRTMVGSLEALKVQNEVVSLDSPQNNFTVGESFVLHALGPAKSPWAYSSELQPWLIKNIGKFDSIIIHGLWLYPSYITVKCLNQIRRNDKGLKTKVFVMPHGMLDPYFQKASSRKLKALRNKIYWQLIESNVVNKAEGLLFTCEEEKILARKPFKPYNPKNETVVGLGVEKPPAYKLEMQRAFLQKCPSVEKLDYLLFLGRIHEKKGVDLLVKAYIEKLADWTKNDNETTIPKLVIAGPGLDSFFGQQIQKLTSLTASIDKYILFPGMLEGDAKWGAFYGCSAFVLPSHQENFGIAVVEALACGKPVLISNQVNIWREIKENEAGIIAENTQAGTIELVHEWKKALSDSKIKLMQQNAEFCYETYFAVGPAANKLFTALQ